jgi:hypothetical protein
LDLASFALCHATHFSSLGKEHTRSTTISCIRQDFSLPSSSSIMTIGWIILVLISSLSNSFLAQNSRISCFLMINKSFSYPLTYQMTFLNLIIFWKHN